MGNVPFGALDVAERIKLAFPFAPGVIRKVTPAGSPEAAKLMLGKLPPPTGVAVILTDDEPPPCRSMAAGETERAKSPRVACGLNSMLSTGCSSITLGAAPR